MLSLFKRDPVKRFKKAEARYLRAKLKQEVFEKVTRNITSYSNEQMNKKFKLQLKLEEATRAYHEARNALPEKPKVVPFRRVK